MDWKLTKPFILASQSPRRQEILRLVELPFELEIPSDFSEFTSSEISDPETLAWENAKGKAQEIARRHQKALVLGVDTIVEIDGKILGKPVDEKDAYRMLKLLSGKTHTVWTGMHLIDTQTKKEQRCVEQTKVTFLDIDDETLKQYIQTGEPMDKAGAYAVQGIGALYIQGIEGDFFNVMGLPVYRLRQILMEF